MDGWMAFARTKADNLLVSHAIAIRQPIKGFGDITWVTQLVTHKEHRQKKLATQLLQAPWGFSNHGDYARLVLTLLELLRATRRRIDIQTIHKHKDTILEFLRSISFLAQCDMHIDANQSIVKTNFFVQQDLEAKIAKCSKDQQPWTMGSLKHGDEWITCTFKEQSPIPMRPDDLALYL